MSQHAEEALTRRFGLEWTAREDGHGFEIAGISDQLMRVFSSRRVSITADLRTRAREFEARYGRKPSSAPGLTGESSPGRAAEPSRSGPT